MQKYALTTQICMQMLAKKISFPSTSLNLHAEICTKKSAEISLQNISVILTLFDVRTLVVEEKIFWLGLFFLCRKLSFCSEQLLRITTSFQVQCFQILFLFSDIFKPKINKNREKMCFSVCEQTPKSWSTQLSPQYYFNFLSSRFRIVELQVRLSLSYVIVVQKRSYCGDY